MPDIDAGPHATPDQIRAAEKRAEAAASRESADDTVARSTPPKDRRSAAENSEKA